MSVTEVKTMSAGLSGRATGTEPSDAVTSYRVRFRTECDSLADDAQIVLAHFRNTSTLPFMGRPYDIGNGFDANAVCRELDAERIEKSPYFTVSAIFEPKNTSGGIGDNAGVTGLDENGEEVKDPTRFRDEIEVSYSPLSVGIQKGIFRGFDPDGFNDKFPVGEELLLMNTAFQPIEGVEDELSITHIRITKFRNDFNSGLFPQFQQQLVNNDLCIIAKAFPYRFTWAIAPWTGRLRPVQTTYGNLNGFNFYRYVLQVDIHPLGWRRSFANLGTAETLKPGDVVDGVELTDNDFGDEADEFKTREFKDEDGHPLSAPRPLTVGGRIADEGDPQVYLNYSISKEGPFAGITW